MIKLLNNKNIHEAYKDNNTQVHFHIFTYSPIFTKYTIHQCKHSPSTEASMTHVKLCTALDTTLYAYGTKHRQLRHLKIQLNNKHRR